jgi:hypothetical protein
VRLRLLVICLVLVLAPVAGAAPAFKATFAAPTHTPKVNAKWFYTVRVTLHGKPARATITSQIVDPVGGVHPVQFGSTKKNVTNRPFSGTFRDYVLFPPEAQGVRLTFRVIVKARGGRRVLTYWVQPR